MEETRFSDIGKQAAIARLFEGTNYANARSPRIEIASKGGVVRGASCLMLEGVDFDLVYFPLKHLGYKGVVGVTGELYAALAQPVSLSVVLGVSAKLDFADIRELWSGIVAGAREFGYKQLSLDLMPSRNGLTISLSAMGETSLLTDKRRPAPKSKDLLCVSGNLGAAYLGLRVLEREKKVFASGAQPSLDAWKMMVGAYLKPELPAGVTGALEDSGIYPSAGCFITHGLADAVKRLALSTGLGAKVYADKIPFEGNSFTLAKELDVDPVAAAMNGGDDFKLLFTVPILSLEKFRHDFQTFDIIGHLAEASVGTVLVLPDGPELDIHAPGWPE